MRLHGFLELILGKTSFSQRAIALELARRTFDDDGSVSPCTGDAWFHNVVADLGDAGSLARDYRRTLHTTPRLFRSAHNGDSPWAAADFDTLQFFAHF